MEENANIDCHLSNMHQIYRRLVDEFECEITNEIGKDVLLQSLPPSYSAFVEGYVMAKNNDNFHQCQATQISKSRESCRKVHQTKRYMRYTML
jgi:hypothetical protein